MRVLKKKKPRVIFVGGKVLTVTPMGKGLFLGEDEETYQHLPAEGKYVNIRGEGSEPVSAELIGEVIFVGDKAYQYRDIDGKVVPVEIRYRPPAFTSLSPSDASRYGSHKPKKQG